MFRLDIDMTESYQVYVGNLPANVSKQQLEELFSQLGDVVNIWINPKYKQVTYAFIGFSDSDTCNEACKRFDNYELDFFKINVRRSFKNIAFLQQKSILLDLPKKKGVSKSHTLKKILCKNLRRNPDMIESFKMATQEMEYLTDSNECEVVKHNPEQCDLETLEETIIRNFKKPPQNKPIPIDFDLTKGKLLSVEQTNKWFNLQICDDDDDKQQQQQQQLKQQFQVVKRKIPFDLDYRSVTD